MACNSCKKKKPDNIIEEQERYFDEMHTNVNIAIGVWLVLGIYGFISLILDIFSLL
jgi:hypothetical protein